jgi:hypothetical protein
MCRRPFLHCAGLTNVRAPTGIRTHDPSLARLDCRADRSVKFGALGPAKSTFLLKDKMYSLVFKQIACHSLAGVNKLRPESIFRYDLKSQLVIFTCLYCIALR